MKFHVCDIKGEKTLVDVMKEKILYITSVTLIGAMFLLEHCAFKLAFL